LSPTLHRPCLASVPSSMYIFAHIASFPPLITCNERFVIRIATLWICIAFDTVKTKHCCSCLQPKYISTSVMSTHSTAMSTSHCSEVNLCSIVLLMCTKSSTAAWRMVYNRWHSPQILFASIMCSLSLTYHCPEINCLNLSACIWTETVPFFWSENTRMVSSMYMTENNPVPEIGRGNLRPHAVIWPPLMFAFTNLGKLVLLSCIHSNKRLSVYIHICLTDHLL